MEIIITTILGIYILGGCFVAVAIESQEKKKSEPVKLALRVFLWPLFWKDIQEFIKKSPEQNQIQTEKEVKP